METPGYFAILTASVRYDNRLKAAEKIFYAEITALANAEGYCYASNAYFANLYNVDNRTIQRWLSNLSKYGYIRITNRMDTSEADMGRKIIPNFAAAAAPKELTSPHDKNVTPHDKNVVPPRQDCHTPHDRNVTHNNTSNNNKENKESSDAASASCEEIFQNFAGSDTQLLAALLAFKADRAERRKPMTSRACERMCHRLKKLTDKAEVQDRSGYMQAMLDNAIRRGWQDVFAVDDFQDRAPVHQSTVQGVDQPRVIDEHTDLMDIL